jgi:hypothetical protein
MEAVSTRGRAPFALRPDFTAWVDVPAQGTMPRKEFSRHAIANGMFAKARDKLPRRWTQTERSMARRTSSVQRLGCGHRKLDAKTLTAAVCLLRPQPDTAISKAITSPTSRLR